MKFKMIYAVLLLVVAISVLGCGNSGGVSQSAYDELQAKNTELEKQNKELQEQLASGEGNNGEASSVTNVYWQYKGLTEGEYNGKLRVYDVMEKVGGGYLEDIDADFYSEVITQRYDEVNALYDEGLAEGDAEKIQNAYASWNDIIYGLEEAEDKVFDAFNMALVNSSEMTSTLSDITGYSTEADDNSNNQKTQYTLLYEDEKVKIYFDDIIIDGVAFRIENLTDANITVQGDSLSINREGRDYFIMSTSIAPQSSGKAESFCNVDDVSTVETIGGSLTIIDFDNSFEQYNATFVNVPIE